MAALFAPLCARAQAPPIEDQLVLQTPVSKFVVDAALKAFTEHAREKWGVTLRTQVHFAGTPVSYGRIVEWKGQPEADVFWGGESALFDKLAEQKLLVRHELPRAILDAVPARLGKPKPIALKDPNGYWVGTTLEPYGLVYHPRLLRRLGVPEPKDWDDLLHPKLKGQIAQCAPTRSSSSHATYEVLLQSRGEPAGWAWLKRLGGHTGVFTARSRDVPSVVAKGEFAAGFGVPSYMAFEEVLAGFDLKFVAPKNAFVTPEPTGILAGARHPRAARAFLEFLLSERGQRVFIERGLFAVLPRLRVQGPPGSVAEKVVEFTGGVRSFFEAETVSIYDEDIAQQRYQDVNERYRKEIEAVWDQLRKSSRGPAPSSRGVAARHRGLTPSEEEI
jgi:ABC-type Fe3+ transport system substrate-binding protein